MGCWNGTDLITGMSINSGDRIGIILLAGNPYKEYKTTHYPSDTWQPVFAPIFGEYDDYGSIENIEDGRWPRELARIFNITTEDKEWLSQLKGLFDAIERYSIGQGDGEFNGVSIKKLVFCMVLPESLKMVRQMPTEHWYKKGDKYVTERSTNEKVAMFQMDEHRDTILKYIEEIEKAESEEKKEMYKTMLSISAFSPSRGNLHFFLEGMFAVPYDFNLTNDEYYQAMINIKSIDWALSGLRRLWHPVTACGSQHDNQDEIIHMAKLTLNLAKRKRKELEEPLSSKIRCWFRYTLPTFIRGLFKRKS